VNDFVIVESGEAEKWKAKVRVHRQVIRVTNSRWMSLRRLSKKSKVDCVFDGSENGPRHVRKRCVSAERIRAQNTIDEDMNEHITWTM
jgi:hypothetical protein